jgi:rfaE bifunctional protein nucleotidyltransferase chain/domain
MGQQLKMWSDVAKQKMLSPDQITEKILELKKLGKKIVSLNGSFDLLHAGHLQMFFEASQCGNCLIVALNTDRSIQGYKSKDRPIIPLQYRLELVAALQWVDYVTWFDELDPIAILRKIEPDIHVNGEEYGEDCIEAPWVKALHLVRHIPGLSTSAIVEKIKRLP